MSSGIASDDEIRAKMKATLDRIDPELGAFITVDADAANRNLSTGGGTRLRGLTVGVKDLIDTAGLRTTYGSPRFRYHVPTRSAPVVTQLERAGAVVIGKTNLNEMAYGVSGFNPHYGLMRTPGDRSRTPGGSSGGSAVAVAAGYCDIGLGTDTGGSVRIPAACCGIIGFKCAHGAVSMKGVHPLAPTHDSIGYLVRSVAVLQRVLAVSKLPEVHELTVCEDGLDLLPPFPSADHWVTFRAQSYALHRAHAERSPEDFGDDLLVKLGGEIGDIARAEATMADWRDEVHRLLDGVDLMLLPVFRGDAPTVEAVMEDYAAKRLTTSDRLLEITPMVNALGWPAMVVPTDAGPRQIVGRPGSEPAILAYGQRICGQIYEPPV